MSEKYKQYLITFNLFDGTMRSVPIEIPLGEPGEDGGYYTPVTEQISDTEFRVSFVPSKDGMPSVDPVKIYSFSPRVKVTDDEDGVTISVEDYMGETNAFIQHGKNGKTPVKGVDYTDGYSPAATVTKTSNGIEITITDKNGTTTATIPKVQDGYSVYYMDVEVDFPEGEGFVSNSISKIHLSNGGYGVKAGDLLISHNGTLCEVTTVNASTVNYEPIANFSGTNAEHAVLYTEQALSDAQKEQARKNINAVTLEDVANASGGNTIYYMDKEVTYPVDGIKFFSVAKNSLSNSGVGIKVGDIIVASNGTLCKAASVESGSKGLVRYDPIGTISGVIADGGTAGYSIYYVDLPLESLDPIYVSSNKISNSGAGIKIGDIVIFSNGTLCEVTEVTYREDGSSVVRCVPKTNIGGSENDSGGNAGFVVQDTPPEDTSVLWIDPTDNTTEVPENSGGKRVISYKNPAEVPLESGSQYIFYGSTGGIISVQVGSNENNKVDYQLSSGFDIVWILYVQTSEVQGSIIATSGTRKVINFEGDSSKMKISSTIPVWIVIKVG